MKKQKIVRSKIKPYPETHQKGHITIDSYPLDWRQQYDLGIQIAEDGRVWICVDGMSFLRFRPTIKVVTEKEK